MLLIIFLSGKTVEVDIIPGQPGSRQGAGRPKGVPNKATTRARDAIAILMENNVPKLEIWLNEVYEQDGPLAAMKVMIDLLEYHIPKLARMEVSQGITNGTEDGVKWVSTPPPIPTIFISND